MPGKSSLMGILASLAVAGLSAEESGFRLEPMHAMASWEAGEVRSFVPDPAAAGTAGKRKHLIDHAAVWLLQEAKLSENIKVYVGVGGMYFFIIPSAGNQYSFGQRSAFGLTDAHGEFEFLKTGEGEHGLLLKAGVFPFKYNEDAKNLGEYMFRTYTYPTLIFTGGLVLVNSAGVQLSGLDANTKIGGINNDLLLTVKTDQIPSGAVSLTDLVSYTFMKFLTVGAGFMFDNFYDPTGIAEGNYAAGGAVSAGTYYVNDTNGTVAYPSNPPTDSVGWDTLHYTFVGQKAMARASVNLGKFIPGGLLSDQDLRIYFEGVLMGLKDYQGYYPKLKNRLAYMYGINLPTFRVLDLLSLEGEYCSNPYLNSSINAAAGLVPIPVDAGRRIGGDNFKWTVYARKSFYKTFSITGQAANDHLRLVDFFGHTNDQDVLQNRKNWYWALQLGYSF